MGGHCGNPRALPRDARSATALRETEKPFIVCICFDCEVPDCPGQIEYTFWTVWVRWPDRYDPCCV